MDIRWLQDFLAVAETGNFTKAAAARHSSQAAFSRRIQQLELWFGAPLIDRSSLPTRLTAEGEAFARQAGETLAGLMDARARAQGERARPDRLRLAVAYALATSRLPEWRRDWGRGTTLAIVVRTGNVHDLGMSLLSGESDLMISFHAAQQPVDPDPGRTEAIEIETDLLRPYAAPALLERETIDLPPAPGRSLPLLAYSPGVYFGRLTALALENAGGVEAARPTVVSDMSDVLLEFAVAGQGVAFLPEATAARVPAGGLIALGGAAWSTPLSIRAWRLKDNHQPTVDRIWRLLETRRRDAKK